MAIRKLLQKIFKIIFQLAFKILYGKIIASGSPNEVISDKTAKNQYFGDEFNIN